jgi:hypothetical protein
VTDFTDLKTQEKQIHSCREGHQVSSFDIEESRAVNNVYRKLRVSALTPEEEERMQRLHESEAQLLQSFMDAELSWREYELEEGNGDGSRPSKENLPLRALWPQRLELRTNGGTQSCSLCLDDIPEPYTLCDVCGAAFNERFKQLHGVDLTNEQSG